MRCSRESGNTDVGRRFSTIAVDADDLVTWGGSTDYSAILLEISNKATICGGSGYYGCGRSSSNDIALLLEVRCRRLSVKIVPLRARVGFFLK